MKPLLELKQENPESLLERVRPVLPDEAYVQIKGVFDTLAYMTQLLENDKTTIHRLRQILFGASTEKLRKVLKQDAAPPEAGGLSQPAPGAAAGPERKGHGRGV